MKKLIILALIILAACEQTEPIPDNSKSVNIYNSHNCTVKNSHNWIINGLDGVKIINDTVYVNGGWITKNQ